MTDTRGRIPTSPHSAGRWRRRTGGASLAAGTLLAALAVAAPAPAAQAPAAPGGAPAAQAPAAQAPAAAGGAQVAGLIVAYAPGVGPTEGPGVVTGSAFVQDLQLQIGQAIGLGLRTVGLDAPMSAEAAEAVAAQLETSPSVLWAEPDYAVSLPDDLGPMAAGGAAVTGGPPAAAPGVASVQAAAPWGLDRIDQRSGLSTTYEYDTTGDGVTAYVIDTGIRATHTEFVGRVGTGFSVVTDGGGTNDCHGHGTHVAGTLGGTTYGVAKQVEIVPVRVLDCNGAGTNAGVISGIDWVVSNHDAGTPAVANMSMGGPASDAVDAAVRTMIDDNITVVVASGNGGTSACQTTPARTAEAITVNASTNADAIASFSNRGSCTDVYAPGAAVLSAWATSDTASLEGSGTSMASPHVAGAAARILERNPRFTPAQVWTALSAATTAVDFVPSDAADPKKLLYAAPTAGAPAPPAVPDGGATGFFLNNRFTGAADLRFDYGNPGDQALMGDWNGDRSDTPGVRRGATFYLRNSNSTGAADVVVGYGNPGDEVLVGDWDGNRTDTLAVRRGNVFYLRNALTSGVADVVLGYGNPGDVVLVGDWDGNGTDTLAVRRGNQFFLRNSLTSGVADVVLGYGNPGDEVLVGDWDGNGTDTLAVRRGNQFYLRNLLTSGAADQVLAYGNPGDEALTGDWDGNGTETLGVRR
ncbi:S8 family peptidase [Georgenia sp. SYP-B2076]|uniref:S8 family peptidase n=1 Tax=Georgenia sp. SYP-B2076 TaxID=2495881 RepID=UPI00197A72B0|nr:S8 family peptidase [Georgenia sp. SYP-B2076]